MSLQVWLPLDGNLENKGIADVTITNNGASVVTDGKVGTCYSFNGSSYVHISKPLNMTTIKNTSICAFVKSTGSTLALGGISHDQGATEACMTLYTSGWQFVGSSTWKYAPGGTIANTSVWHHVCCVMTDTNIITYLDGKEFSNVTISSVGVDQFNLTANTFVEIGCDHPGGDEFLTGLVKDFRVYDHALTDIEVKEISDTYAPLTLICHLPLDKTDGSFTVYDESGYGNNGTLSTNKPTITSGAPKKYNSSMLFANDRYVSISIPYITNSANSYTFSWWGKCTVYENKMYWGFSDGNRLNLYGTGGGYCWNTGDGATNKFTGTIFAHEIDGNWHHFAVTGNGTSTQLYIDGGFRANATTYKGITGTNIIINGWNTANDYNFNGQLSDFRIYASVLSEEEIFELYNTTNHPNLNSTVFTDTASFTNESDLYVKEIHLHELQNAITKLNSYLPNVDNCGYVNCCESCQDSCICQSDKCQSCQNACNQCTDKCQSCQNACNQCTDKCQKCQNTCTQCTDKCQSCQYVHNRRCM